MANIVDDSIFTFNCVDLRVARKKAGENVEAKKEAKLVLSKYL